MIVHRPVLLNEVLTYLDPQQNQTLLDATVGQGGHAEALLQRILPVGRLLGMDRDAVNLETSRQRLAHFGDRVTLVCDSYAQAKQQAEAHGFAQFDGILMDIGFSSAHIEEAGRGFSFQKDGPLDMRYDQAQDLTAAIIVNGWDEDDLAKLFRTLGEEGHARTIAEAIVATRRHRPLATTTELADVITSAVRRQGKIHPATKAFQALRIAVNDELGQLEAALPQMVDLLAPGGRLAVISFHSLEDRIVKRFMAASDGKNTRSLTKKVVTASREEWLANPRARSAKMRAVEKMA